MFDLVVYQRQVTLGTIHGMAVLDHLADVEHLAVWPYEGDRVATAATVSSCNRWMLERTEDLFGRDGGWSPSVVGSPIELQRRCPCVTHITHDGRL